MGDAILLSRRALNRATLDRQMLLERSDAGVTEALERLVGLQAQTPHTWYLGLWSRLNGYTPDATAELLREGGIVRIALMRSTIHLVTAADCLWLRPALEPMIQRMTRTSWGRGVVGLDVTELVAAARELMTAEALTFSELGRRLAERFPDHDGASMAQTVRAYVPLAQVPPRGVWGESGPAAHKPADIWISGSAEVREVPNALEEIVLRYLAAFGPASVRDVQRWCGLTRLNEVMEGLRHRLMSFRDEDGRELFDLPEAPRPDADTPAPVRFIYDYDNLLRSHADISRVMTVKFAAQGFEGKNGEAPSTVLVDGSVAATWRVTKARGTATLRVRPFRKLTSAEEEDVEREARGVLAFLAGNAKERVVEFAAPEPG